MQFLKHERAHARVKDIYFHGSSLVHRNVPRGLSRRLRLFPIQGVVMRISCALLALAITSLNVHGASKESAIGSLQSDVAMAELTIMTGSLQMETGDLEGSLKSQKEIHDLGAKIDGEVEAAVRAAKGKPDLARAIKEFYAAASAYVSAGLPTNRIAQVQSERLKNELDTKSKALELEMKLSK